MPYITPNEREKFEPELEKLRDCIMVGISKGDMTYVFYSLSKKYIDVTGKSYTNISTVISSLIDAAEELRRRELNPYEDQKITDNGDVN